MHLRRRAGESVTDSLTTSEYFSDSSSDSAYSQLLAARDPEIADEHDSGTAAYRYWQLQAQSRDILYHPFFYERWQERNEAGHAWAHYMFGKKAWNEWIVFGERVPACRNYFHTIDGAFAARPQRKGQLNGAELSPKSGVLLSRFSWSSDER